MRFLAKDTHPRLRASDLGQDVFRGFGVNLYDGCGQRQVDSLTDIRTLNKPFIGDLLRGTGHLKISKIDAVWRIQKHVLQEVSVGDSCHDDDGWRGGIGIRQIDRSEQKPT